MGNVLHVVMFWHCDSHVTCCCVYFDVKQIVFPCNEMGYINWICFALNIFRIFLMRVPHFYGRAMLNRCEDAKLVSFLHGYFHSHSHLLHV